MIRRALLEIPCLTLLVIFAGCATVAAPAAPEGKAALLDKARASLAIAARPGRAEGSPLFLVHYMPWFQAPPISTGFGWHWHMGSTDPYEKNSFGLSSIASHYYPLTGPYDSADPALIEYQLQLMKLSGIDGVIVDWYGVSKALDYVPLHAATEKLFAAIAKAGLKFALCYEDQSIGNRVQAGVLSEAASADALKADMTWADAFWFSEDAYLKWDGRPVVLDFGPAYIRDPRVWTSVLSTISPQPLLITLDGAGASSSDGAFSWPPMSSSIKGVLTPGALVDYLNSFSSTAQARSYIVATAFPGFRDFYGQARVRASYGFLDDYAGAMLSFTMDAAQRSHPNAVQIATWNDYGEGTMIEPTVQNGYRDLESIQDIRRTVDPAFPFTHKDLLVPLQIWSRRIAGAEAGLDGVAAAVNQGDAEAFHAALSGIGVDASSLPVSLTPVERQVARPKPSLAEATPDPYASSANLARGARINANNHIYDFTAEKAVDGEVRTYWEGAANAYPEEITLDLGTTQPLAALRVRLNPQLIWQARTQVFSVLASPADGEPYTVAVPSAPYRFDPAVNANTVTVPLSVSARYLRLSFSANDGSTGAQVAEWEVYGR